MTPESRILAEIRIALSEQAPDAVFWRLHQGQGYTPDGRHLRGGLVAGAADLIGVGPGGRFLAIEVKAPRGKVSREQTQWGAIIRKHGGFYAVVRSVPDALAALERARRGETE